MSASEHLIELVRSSDSPALDSIADALEAGRINLGSSPVGIGALRHVSDDVASAAFATFRAVRESLDPFALATALRTAVGIRERERLERPDVEVTWTGPDADGPVVTQNSTAVHRLLEDCQDTGQILLVGYSFTVEKDSAMREAIDLLVDASHRRAKIQIILHQDETGKNRDELMKHWDVFARKPAVFTWDPPRDLPYTKLHAKCLVVDRLQLLVTSSNFTLHGLKSNLELGLLVRNQPLATAVHNRFDTLISMGVLRPWTMAK